MSIAVTTQLICFVILQKKIMLRTNTWGELNSLNIGETVTLSGWIHRNRDLGGMTFIDLRDRYGITQIAFNMDVDKVLWEAYT